MENSVHLLESRLLGWWDPGQRGWIILFIPVLLNNEHDNEMPTNASEGMAKNRTLKLKAKLSVEPEKLRKVEAQMKNLLCVGV